MSQLGLFRKVASKNLLCFDEIQSHHTNYRMFSCSAILLDVSVLTILRCSGDQMLDGKLACRKRGMAKCILSFDSRYLHIRILSEMKRLKNVKLKNLLLLVKQDRKYASKRKDSVWQPTRWIVAIFSKTFLFIYPFFSSLCPGFGYLLWLIYLWVANSLASIKMNEYS